MSTSLSPKQSASFISKSSKHVSVIDEGINKLSEKIFSELKHGNIHMNIITEHECYPKELTEKQTVDWIFMIDTLNFCFWTPSDSDKWEILYKNKKYTGYFALCAAIARAMDEGIDMIDPHVYSNLTMNQIKKIFRSDTNREMPLLKERLVCLNEVGNILIEKYSGSFVNCIDICNKSAIKLLNLIVSDFKCFYDFAVYKGQTVTFNKRAQITVADIWSMFRGKSYGEFFDIHEITMFADYRVPQVLVYFNSLKYSEELMELLRNDKMLENGSEYEVEIRGCSIEVIERVNELVHQKIKEDGGTYLCNSILIDNYLWKYRREFALEFEKIPFHKVISIYY